MTVTAHSTTSLVTAIDGTNGVHRTTEKPRLLVCASPATGHTTPVLNIAEELVQRGYDVTMIAGEEFQPSVKNIGAKGIVIPPMMTEDMMAQRSSIPAGVEQLKFDMKEFFINPTQGRMEALYKALEDMREEDPEREIIIVTETFYMGTHPMYLGAPLPKGFTKRPRVVNIHAACYLYTSMDSAPLGLTMPPDATDEGRERNKALHAQMAAGPWADLITYEAEVLTNLGAVNFNTAMLWDTWSTSHDITLQMCHPSLEYPRSDIHPKIKFVGSLPSRPLKKDMVFPSFWSEVTSGDKRVVVVTQGTVALQYENLLIPTLRALADREDLIVIAILGKKGATLPDDFSIPSNARVVDYLSYDAILPYTSVFVLNAGYGGFTHGVVNGVPMVLSGDSEDKPEVAARGEWSGVAVNLKTGRPTPKQVAEGVSQVLANPDYKKRVLSIKRENEEMRAMDSVEKAILDMAALG